MSYDIQQWLNDSLTTPINAQRLGYMETGIKNAAQIADQALAAASVVNSGIPGAVYFDTFFSGADDNAKFTAMNSWMEAMTGPTPVVFFAARQYNHNVPIKLFSGLKMAGSAGFAAREFSRGTVINWQGAANTSQFIFPGSQPAGQSYPTDGSPRDCTFTGIQWQGGSSTHFLPKLTTSGTAGQNLWYFQWHNCAWKSFNTIWWGAGTGCSITGITHMQGAGMQGNSPLQIGGSENHIFGNDGFSFVDRSIATGTPFIRSSMYKSTIGQVMITARQSDFFLSVEFGESLTMRGVAFDAQGSDPVYGAGIKISGCDGITFDGCSFKGMATTPASGAGGSSANRAWIMATGGAQMTFTGNHFRREGNNIPATSYPLLYASSGTANVKWGYNNYSAFGGSPAVIQQAVAGKLTAQDDPALTVVTAA